MKKLPHISFGQCLASVRCQQTKLFFQVFSRDSFHHFYHQPWEAHTPSPSPTASQTIHRSCSKADLVHTTNRSDCRHDLGLAENRIGLAENRRRRRKTREKKKVLQKKRIKDYEEEDAGDDACPLFFFFLFSSFKKKHNILRYIQKILCKYY